MTFAEYDKVRLTRAMKFTKDNPITEYELEAGIIGTVLDCHGNAAYEVEFFPIESVFTIETEHLELVKTSTKECVHCHVMKPLTTEYFHASRTTTWGFNPWCKVCANACALNYHRARRAVINRSRDEARQLAARHKALRESLFSQLFSSDLLDMKRLASERKEFISTNDRFKTIVGCDIESARLYHGYWKPSHK